MGKRHPRSDNVLQHGLYQHFIGIDGYPIRGNHLLDRAFQPFRRHVPQGQISPGIGSARTVFQLATRAHNPWSSTQRSRNLCETTSAIPPPVGHGELHKSCDTGRLQSMLYLRQRSSFGGECEDPGCHMLALH
jgi:hypothetical protein